MKIDSYREWLWFNGARTISTELAPLPVVRRRNYSDGHFAFLESNCNSGYERWKSYLGIFYRREHVTLESTKVEYDNVLNASIQALCNAMLRYCDRLSVLTVLNYIWQMMS